VGHHSLIDDAGQVLWVGPEVLEPNGNRALVQTARGDPVRRARIGRGDHEGVRSVRIAFGLFVVQAGRLVPVVVGDRPIVVGRNDEVVGVARIDCEHQGLLLAELVVPTALQLVREKLGVA
jgi:hypothetical protein